MKKTFKIEIDCANCANQVEDAARKISGIEDVTISFMTQRMKVTFAEDADPDMVMADVMKVARKIEPDFEIL